MTIAACYVSPEGVVFGADSTASLVSSPGGFHYFNHNQKLFEIGENSTVAALTWGLGGLASISWRTLFAELDADLHQTPPANFSEIATRWRDRFWQVYSTVPDLQVAIQQCRALNAKPPFDPAVLPPDPNARTEKEEEEFHQLRLQLAVGFAIGGYWLPDRTPIAYVMQFEPLAAIPPTPVEIHANQYGFWGAPNIFQRLIVGSDDRLKQELLHSGRWTGTEAELTALLEQQRFGHPILPIREAIDFVHACIYSTIKTLKFSSFSQICGGPIELAVITTDRRFRWVRHKAWDAAIGEGVAL